MDETGILSCMSDSFRLSRKLITIVKFRAAPRITDRYRDPAMKKSGYICTKKVLFVPEISVKFSKVDDGAVE